MVSPKHIYKYCALFTYKTVEVEYEILMQILYFTTGIIYVLNTDTVQVQNCHIDKAVAKVTLIRYNDTALFYAYLKFLNGISISICKL